MKSVRVGDIQMNYRITGTGKPIVLLHGYGFDSTSWDGVIAFLKEDYKIILPDFPGFGMSEGSGYSVTVEVLAKLVNDIIISEKVTPLPIIGHSMGGYVALNILKLYPENLIGLGLLHSHPFADDEKKKREREKGIKFVHKYGSQRYAKETLPYLFDEQYKMENPEHLEMMVKGIAEIPEEIIGTYLRAMINRSDTSDLLVNIPYPLLLQLGETDKTIPLEKGLETSILPDVCLLQILYGIGHMGLIEQAGITAQNIRGYLELLQY